MAKETENKLEELFDKLLTDGDATALLAEWDNLNRLEQYLVCILTKSNIECMGSPLNRLEVLLQALYNKKV